MNVAKGPISLNIAREFSRRPGPRFVHEGKFSGEEFREKLLKKRFEQAYKAGAKLHVDLDGVYGYAPSFLEEAFGGLVRQYDPQTVRDTIILKADEQPLLIERILGYLRDART
jgi:STAS-like domain of unknown function (DUF4325)